MKKHGFTLMEVLVALAIVAIALTALLKATSQDVVYTQRIKEKTIQHWVEMQAVAMIQLGSLPIAENEEVAQVTTMLGQRWYWRAKLIPTNIPSMKKICIRVSQKQAGPFKDELVAFKHVSS